MKKDISSDAEEIKDRWGFDKALKYLKKNKKSLKELPGAKNKDINLVVRKKKGIPKK